VDKKAWDETDLGYRRPEGHRLTAQDRVEMGELAPEARADSFVEIVAGYNIEQAKVEADRCVACGLCVATCPAHMSVPEYIAAIRDGDYEQATRLLYETNPFSHVCGRVCTHKCETACAARHEGDPIAIRWLKRHIMDQVPHERVKEIAGEGRITEPSGKTIGIVGAGPAGLTAAFDLAKAGHGVTVYEANPFAGGMMRYGIPEYRLPYDKLDADIDVIRSMGVEIRCNTRIGDDIKLEQLRDQHDSVLLSIGLHLARSTRIPGSDHPEVYSAVDLLRRVTLGETIEVPETIAVIGGGNVAMDIARTLARLQRQRYGKVGVTLVALEAEDKMLADREEIDEAREEAVLILPARGPKECVIDACELTGLKTVRCLSIFDDKGRFAPKYDEDDTQIHPAQMIVEAIGQAADTSCLGEPLTEALEWNRNRIRIDADGRTSEPWLWAAGDAVEGPDVIHAVAAGHRVAQSMLAAFAQG
jgi:glutamate synthase (NADPH/NADH) small chain